MSAVLALERIVERNASTPNVPEGDTAPGVGCALALAGSCRSSVGRETAGSSQGRRRYTRPCWRWCPRYCASTRRSPASGHKGRVALRRRPRTAGTTTTTSPRCICCRRTTRSRTGCRSRSTHRSPSCPSMRRRCTCRTNTDRRHRTSPRRPSFPARCTFRRCKRRSSTARPCRNRRRCPSSLPRIPGRGADILRLVSTCPCIFAPEGDLPGKLGTSPDISALTSTVNGAVRLPDVRPLLGSRRVEPPE